MLKVVTCATLAVGAMALPQSSEHPDTYLTDNDPEYFDGP